VLASSVGRLGSRPQEPHDNRYFSGPIHLCQTLVIGQHI